MNKRFIIPVIALSIAALASCGQDEGEIAVIVPDAPVVSTVTTTEAITTTKAPKTTKAAKTTKEAKTTKATTTTTTAATTTATDYRPLDIRFASELSDEELYNVNIFLSNFAEQNFGDYDSKIESLYQRVYFCYTNTKINSPETYAKFAGQYDSFVPLDFMSERSERFFGKSISEQEAKGYRDPYSSDSSYYKDGYFHFEYGDGESHTYMACVDYIEDLEDKSHFVGFNVYDMSSLCDETVDAKYYGMTCDELEKAGAKKYKTGNAEITDNKYNGKDTYILNSYYAYDLFGF